MLFLCGRGRTREKRNEGPRSPEESVTSSDKCFREGDRAEECEGATGLESWQVVGELCDPTGYRETQAREGWGGGTQMFWKIMGVSCNEK